MPPAPTGYAFGPFRLLPARRLLLRRDHPVSLTPKAFDTLVTLVEGRDRVVTKDELLQRVWGDVVVEEENITQQVSQLRKALGESAGDQFIATVPRRGYRFVKEVELEPEGYEPTPPKVRRLRPNWAFMAGASMMMVAVAAAAFLRPRALAPLDSNLVLTQLTREPEVESFPSISPDGREFVYASGPLDYFGESDIYRREVGSERSFNLTPDSPGADTQPALSPDGAWIAFRSDRDGGGIFVMRRDGTGVRPLTREGYNPAWSPDGSEVAYATVQSLASPYANNAALSSLKVVNVQNGTVRTVRERGAGQPSWSPHGNRFAFWARGTVSTCARDGTDAVSVVESAGTLNWNPVWAPDGTYLYYSSNRGGPFQLWRVRMEERTGRASDAPEPAPVRVPSTFAAHAAFDATGRHLLFTSCPITASILRYDFDVTSGVVHGTATPVTRGVHSSVWPEPSPDGRRVAFHRGVIEQEDIFVSDPDGGGLKRLTDDPALDRVARWSPDGRRLAFYSPRGGQANIWVVDADGRDLREATHSTESPVIFAAWSPDGRLAASEGPPGSRSFIFDPDQPWNDGKDVKTLPVPQGGGQFVPWSWSPDGTRLAGLWRPPIGRQRERIILVLDLAAGRYSKFRCEARQPTPVWLPDGQRLVYAADNRLLLLDLRTGDSREILNPGPGRLELANGGGFSVSAATGHIYIAPILREGDIWLASQK